jgi:segregation and condensation protein B
MEIGNIIPHIEALIFASDKPLTSMEITELINNAFGFMEEKLTLEQIQTGLDGIVEKYASEFYPFEVRESGGGWQFLTKKDYHKTVAQLNGEKFLKRLSSAALETLAIVAYKQPITKGEIESIRGVSSDYSIQKLLEKELIIISGRNEEMPGKPLVYSTSKTFMDYFGINSPADLPKLKEVFAETMIEPTIISHSPGETLPADEDENPVDGAERSDESLLIVSENGELIEHADVQDTAEEPGTGDQALDEDLESNVNQSLDEDPESEKEYQDSDEDPGSEEEDQASNEDQDSNEDPASEGEDHDSDEDPTSEDGNHGENHGDDHDSDDNDESADEKGPHTGH